VEGALLREEQTLLLQIALRTHWCMKFWIVELPGDADEVRQIAITKPDHSAPSTSASHLHSDAFTVSSSAITNVRVLA
jgi:hypothetical protein